MVSWLKASLVALGLASQLLVVGCKQGENEVCQVNADCEQGLTCNANTGRCQSEVQGVPDAAPSTPDAAPTTPDAASAPDASAPDAATPDAAADPDA